MAADDLYAAMSTGLLTERVALRMILYLGTLGGLLRVLASLVKYVGNRRFRRSWIPYYFIQPLLGAGLALVVTLLLRIGVLAPANFESGSDIAQVNVLGFYGIALLTGLFAKNAMDKLGEVFRTLFQTSSGDQDPLESHRPAGRTGS